MTRYEPFAIEALIPRPSMRRAAADAPGPDFHHHCARLRVFGELDDATAAVLVDAVGAAACGHGLLPHAPGSIVELDLSRLGFCDLAGARAIGDARAALQGLGSSLCVSGPRRMVRRLLDLAIVYGWLPTDLECTQRPWLFPRSLISQRATSTDCRTE